MSDTDVTSLREIPGLVPKLSADDLHALLRWRAAYGRAEARRERAAVVAWLESDECVGTSGGPVAADQDDERAFRISRGEHVSVQGTKTAVEQEDR